MKQRFFRKEHLSFEERLERATRYLPRVTVPGGFFRFPRM